MKMKKIVLFSFVATITAMLFSCGEPAKTDKTGNDESKTKAMADTSDLTNNFYDNAEKYALKTYDLEVGGEVSNPGKVDLSKLPRRSVIVKETLLDGDGDKFVGAYCYDGYSLFDILNNYHIEKKNEDVFKPIIDLYVEVENEAGEKVVFSWGEIYYPNHLHEIIIATDVMRIVPSKTNELWELPTDSKLVVVSDLITERNISKPTKITVKSYEIDLVTIKGKDPLFSPKFDFYKDGEVIASYTANPKNIQEITLHTIFYGRGRGIHSTQPFTGAPLKQLINEKVNRTQGAIRNGLILATADDGYRGVYTYSEICNRNDQADVLLVCHPEVKTDGIFRLFPSCDFFSDRAIKGLNGIYYSE